MEGTSGVRVWGEVCEGGDEVVVAGRLCSQSGAERPKHRRVRSVSAAGGPHGISL